MPAVKTTKKAAKKTAAKKTAAKKKKKDPKLPTIPELAATFGVIVQKPLPNDAIWRLRKAVPGYSAMLDDAAELLEAEGDALKIKDVEPADLLAAQTEQKFLVTREAILYAVYRSVYEQRLQVDDRAMKMLEKIARRVNALAEDDPTLKARWKLLLDFLATFRQGGAPAKGEAKTEAKNNAPAEPPAPTPAPAPTPTPAPSPKPTDR